MMTDVQDFYADELSTGGWRTLTTSTINDAVSIFFEKSGGDSAGQVTIVDDGGTTTIVVVVGEGFADGGDAGSGGDGSDSSGGDATQIPDDGGSGTGDDELPDEVDVPSEFPSDRVPLPDGARVTSAITTTADGATSHLLQFYTKDSVEDVADYFESQLEGTGLAQTITSSQDGGVFAIYSENEDGTGLTVTVTVSNSEVPGYASATLQVIDQ
jgi:hypothetical protein